MGSKPFIAFLPLIRPHLRNSGLALAIAASIGLMGGCLSDGPNRTGGEFLESHDIRLQNPLYHVVLPSFPVDSVWTLDPNASNAFDSVLMLGKSGDFEGQVRLAFDMADTLFLDSIRGDSSAFRLSVGPFISSGAGMGDLIRSVGDSATASSPIYRDSITVLVQSWAIADLNSDKTTLSKEQRADTLKRYNSRFIIRQDPVSLLTKMSAVDTIRLQVKGAYVKNNLQARALPHLRKHLTQLPGSPKVLIQLHLSVLPDSNTEAMGLLRLDNRFNASRASGTYHGPALLVGTPTTTALTASTKQRLSPIYANENYTGNSILTYAGPTSDLIPARNRRLHLVLNRKKLKDSIEAFFKKSAITLPTPSGSGKFDNTYFVPFAQINIPLDTNRLEGQFPINFSLRSDLDSILPEVPTSLMRSKSFVLDKPSVLLNVYSRTEPNKVVDTVSILFQKPKRESLDSNYLQIIIRHNSDSTRNDSTFIQLGETKSKTIGYSLGYANLNLSMVAIKAKSGRLQESELVVSYYLSNTGVYETNAFRDPVTGKLLTSIADQVTQANKSPSDGITLRATRGLQMLLNRADAGQEVSPEFIIQTGSATDTAANIGGKTSSEYIPYPVLNIIPPKLTGSKLTVSLDFYLYPLKQEP